MDETLAIHGGPPVRKRPFPDWPVFGEREETYVLEALRSGKWGGSGQVKRAGFQAKLPEWERRFAQLQGAKYGVSVVNGTMAITVALQAAGVKPGDEVIIPPYTFIASASAALLFGAVPVFADVKAETMQLDPEQVKRAITPRTRAVLTVHLGGGMGDMTRLKQVADSHGLALIEDAAQAIGARWDGIGAGAWGDAGTFSFQSSKNLTAGEGGIVLTSDPELMERAWSVANVGRVLGGAWYQHERIGWNLRMTEFQAAILLAQLDRLEEQLARRHRNAMLLDRLLGEVEGVRFVHRNPRNRHGWHLYLFRLADRVTKRVSKAEWVRMVQAEGIPVSPGYFALNKHPAVMRSIRDWTGEHRAYPCPAAERLAEREAVWLGQQVLLDTEAGMEEVARAITKVNRYVLATRS